MLDAQMHDIYVYIPLCLIFGACANDGQQLECFGFNGTHTGLLQINGPFSMFRSITEEPIEDRKKQNWCIYTSLGAQMLDIYSRLCLC